MIREMPRAASGLKTVENSVSFIAVFLLAVIPAAKAVARVFFQSGFRASDSAIVHLVLIVTFLGGMITSREGRHLSISSALNAVPDRLRSALAAAVSFLTISFTVAFAWSSLSFVLLSFDMGMKIAWIPIRLIALIMPAGFLVMALRTSPHIHSRRAGAVVMSSGLFFGTLLALPSLGNLAYMADPETAAVFDGLSGVWSSVMRSAAIPVAVLLLLSAFFGTPLFVVLGGTAYLLFSRSGGAPEVIANEAYTLLTGNMIPAIPLFTLAGFILSESSAGSRLVRLFKAFFGWLPGGLVIVAVLVSAFFTTFTGASGVTILALGGLLSYILVESGKHSKDYTTGLLTAAGSIGILFPPSLPIILYGVAAGINVLDLFIAGILPGILMVTVMSLTGVFSAKRHRTSRTAFDPKEAFSALGESLWEVLVPVIIAAGYFSGILTLVETAAVTLLYALLIEVIVHREIALQDLVGKVIMKSIPIIGGVLIILALAKGLSYYIVDTQAPQTLSAWVEAHIGSRFLFLIFLNIALLLTGCLMDIFSAIIVVVPLILPLGEAFGIDPIHLGIIFIANMEVGFITPPVGLNLFLASYRFSQPLLSLYRQVFPFFLIQLGLVLIITYVPALSTVLLTLFAR